MIPGTLIRVVKKTQPYLADDVSEDFHRTIENLSVGSILTVVKCDEFESEHSWIATVISPPGRLGMTYISEK